MLASVCLYSCREESIKTREELLKAITPGVQQKTIDPSIDNLIEGEKGVRVFIPANSLVFENGTKAAGQATVNLEEFLSAPDFFSRRLSTVAGTDLLETGGMINLTASSNGKALFVDGPAAIVVAFPATDTLPGMETFYGSISDSAAGTPSDWTGASQLFGDGGIALGNPTNDSSLYTNRVTVCGYLATANNKDLEWKIKHKDSTVFLYVANNFNGVLKEQLCERESIIISMILSIDSSGKITGIKPGYDDTAVTLIKAVFPFFRDMPAFDMSSIDKGSAETDYTLSLCCHKQIDPVKYKERFEKKYAPYKDKALKAIGKTEIGFYLLTSKSLGWINCDRFYTDPAPKIDFVVTTSGAANPQVMLIFENIKSVMQGEQRDGQFVFRNVPANSKVKIVGTGEGKDQALLAVQSTTISKDVFRLEGYAPFSLNEFQQKLK